MNRDMHLLFDAAVSIQPHNATAIVDGAGVDLLGYEACELLVAIGDTDGTLTVEIEESDDNVAFSAVAAEDIVGGDATVLNVAATDDNTVKRIGYVGYKRYVRLAVTAEGVTSGCEIAGIVCRGRSRHGVDGMPPA